MPYFVFFYKNSKPSYFSSPTFKNGGSKYISPFKSNKHILLRVVKLTSLTFNAKYKSKLPIGDDEEYEVDESEDDEEQKDGNEEGKKQTNSAIKALQRRFSRVAHLPATMIEANVTTNFLKEKHIFLFDKVH